MVRILSIDGGGIRGVIPARVLERFESMLQRHTGNSNARIADFFDLIAASGTGTITACGHLVPDVVSADRPKYKASEIVAFFTERGAEIYDIPLSHRIRTANGLLDEKYPSEGLMEALKDYFDDCTLSQLIKPCLFTSYDMRKRQAYLFRRHEAKNSNGRDFPVKEMLRAATATPTYFECSMISSVSGLHYVLIDGSIFANNPSQAALAESLRLHRNDHSGYVDLKDVMLLSLGTGRNKKMHRFEDARNWGMAEWSKPAIHAAAEGQADMADFQLSNIFEMLGASENYLRISPAIPEDLPGNIDIANKEHIKSLLELGSDAAQEMEPKMNAFISRLLKLSEKSQD